MELKLQGKISKLTTLIFYGLLASQTILITDIQKLKEFNEIKELGVFVQYPWLLPMITTITLTLFRSTITKFINWLFGLKKKGGIFNTMFNNTLTTKQNVDNFIKPLYTNLTDYCKLATNPTTKDIRDIAMTWLDNQNQELLSKVLLAKQKTKQELVMELVEMFGAKYGL